MRIINQEEADFAPLWQTLWQQDPFQHPFYMPLSLAYQRIYLAAESSRDLSFVVADGTTPLLGLLMILSGTGTGPELSVHGHPLLHLSAPGIAPRRMQGAFKRFREALAQRLQTCPPGTVLHYRDALPGNALTPLGRHLLDSGARATPRFFQRIDLAPDLPALRADLRKSYKSLINWGARHLDIRLHDGDTITAADMDHFRALHIRVAGRETRSRESWMAQLRMVHGGEAFALSGRLDGELVTFALFILSPRTGYYGVSASVRERFADPLGHALLWTAIERARALGCRWFDLGEQLFSYQTSATDKERQIARFKRGFGGDTLLALDIRLELPPSAADPSHPERP